MTRVPEMRVRYGDEQVVVTPSHLMSLSQGSSRKIPFTKAETTFNGVINQLSKLYDSGTLGHGRASLRVWWK